MVDKNINEDIIEEFSDGDEDPEENLKGENSQSSYNAAARFTNTLVNEIEKIQIAFMSGYQGDIIKLLDGLKAMLSGHIPVDEMNPITKEFDDYSKQNRRLYQMKKYDPEMDDDIVKEDLIERRKGNVIGRREAEEKMWNILRRIRAMLYSQMNSRGLLIPAKSNTARFGGDVQ